MGLVEFIKDILGVMDDVDDFTDRAVKIRSRLDKTLALVDDGAEWLKDRLKSENIRTAQDLKFIVSYMREVTGRKGEILRLLQEDSGDVDDLLRKAEQAKGEIKGIDVVVQTLKELKRDIDKAANQHRDTFKEADNIIRAYARIRSSDRFAAAFRILVGAAISFATATVVLRGMNRDMLARLGRLESATSFVRSEARG